MLTVAEEELHRLAEERGKQVSTHLYGQEINAETYAICKADLLLKGEGEAADNIVGGPEHSTLSNDAFPTREFDFMLSNPPYGKSWKTDLQRMGGKKGMSDHRFLIEHAGDPEYSLVTRSSDGQMLFLANKLSKMKRDTPLGSRIAEVHNGSSLFTGSAGQGESNIRRWIIENDWLEAIVALPLNMFYNTGIATYVWVLTNRKPERRLGKVQLIDATKWFRPLRKNLGKKNCELGPEGIERICRTFLDFEETEESADLRQRGVRVLEGDGRASAPAEGGPVARALPPGFPRRAAMLGRSRSRTPWSGWPSHSAKGLTSTSTSFSTCSRPICPVAARSSRPSAGSCCRPRCPSGTRRRSRSSRGSTGEAPRPTRSGGCSSLATARRLASSSTDLTRR